MKDKLEDGDGGIRTPVWKRSAVKIFYGRIPASRKGVVQVWFAVSYLDFQKTASLRYDTGDQPYKLLVGRCPAHYILLQKREDPAI